MSNELADKLACMNVGGVLDVATGKGDFLKFLTDNLGGYALAVGVDMDAEALRTAAGLFAGNDKVSLLKLNGERLPFEDGEFDLVCISNALHHLSEPRAVLAEMLRVCRSGCGKMLVREMYRETADRPQEVFHEYHDLVCQMRSELGHSFERVYHRQEVVKLVCSMGIANPDVFDYSEPPGDPHDPQGMKMLDERLSEALQSLAGSGKCKNYESYRRRVEQFKSHLAEFGCRRPLQAVIIGNVR